jgi:hypothetical protein
VLHFIPDEDDPQASVNAFSGHMAAGSFLALSHIASTGTAPAVMSAIREAYRTASAPAVFRSQEEIAAFFAGLDLIHPGLVDVPAWRASGRPSAPSVASGGSGETGRRGAPSAASVERHRDAARAEQVSVTACDLG